ncbi:hypothetical protein GLP37_20385 [Photobacterium phosphoreum]|uniref:phage adaptor protein n=1 Tax=Photobacterium phosphoreum TaxID=659 RepID=UPI001E407561|nr:DUF6682 family protein [Photobacterium phosphoreum]MCD9504524.1 hypothetical protein [Photobacterium phosphoreum]
MIAVEQLLAQAAATLVDPSFVRWTKNELIDYLNDALSAVITRKPNAVIVRERIEAVGNPIQLPDDTYSLLSIEQIGGVRGQFTPIESLDRFFPDWRTKQGEPKCWTKSADELTQFWLYPAPQELTHVDVQYSKVLKAKEGESLAMSSVYTGILLDFILYRAFSKDAENASESQKAVTHYQAFNAALGDKNVTDSALQTNFNQSVMV